MRVVPTHHPTLTFAIRDDVKAAEKFVMPVLGEKIAGASGPYLPLKELSQEATKGQWRIAVRCVMLMMAAAGHDARSFIQPFQNNGMRPSSTLTVVLRSAGIQRVVL